jgi:hypothetical protein
VAPHPRCSSRQARRWVLASASVLALACSGGSSSSPAAVPAAPEQTAIAAEAQTATSDVFSRGRGVQHLLLTIELSEAGARVADARHVQGTLPKRQKHGGAKWLVEVLDAGDHVLFDADVPPAHSLHGEFADSHGDLERVEVASGVEVVTVRVPLLDDGETIRVSAPPEALPGADKRRARPAVHGSDRVELASVEYPQEAP